MTMTNRDKIEAHLFQEKSKKTIEQGRGNEKDVPLSEVGIYQVLFPYKSILLEAGMLVSSLPPEGEDIFDLCPMEDFHDYAKSALEDEMIQTTDEFFEAFTECRKDPTLVIYRRMNEVEINERCMPPKNYWSKEAEFWKSPEGKYRIQEFATHLGIEIKSELTD